jgi:hypothetical protein
LNYDDRNRQAKSPSKNSQLVLSIAPIAIDHSRCGTKARQVDPREDGPKATALFSCLLHCVRLVVMPHLRSAASGAPRQRRSKKTFDVDAKEAGRDEPICGLMTAERLVRWRIAYPDEIVMFHGTYDRAVRADRYRKVAAEYVGFSEAATDPFLGSYHLRIAEDYQDQSQSELRALERERVAALAGGKPTASSEIEANAARGRGPPQEGKARGGLFAAGL